MDWLFDSPWTFWLILALLFAIIEMLSLDLFFLMLSLSALITSAISPFIEHFFARGIVFAVLCIFFVLILRPPLLKRSTALPEILLQMPKLFGVKLFL